MITNIFKIISCTMGVLIWIGILWDAFATIVLPRTVAPMRRLSGRFYKWSWRALGRGGAEDPRPGDCA